MLRADPGVNQAVIPQTGVLVLGACLDVEGGVMVPLEVSPVLVCESSYAESGCVRTPVSVLGTELSPAGAVGQVV